MNQILEKAISIARTFSESDQEDLGRELLRLAEEKQIDARLAEAEANGGLIPADEFWKQVKSDIAEDRQKLNTDK